MAADRSAPTRPSGAVAPTLRALGCTGLMVSPLCLGAMNFGDPTDPEESTAIIDAALDGGITMIDTADVYAGGRSEEIVGAALAANGRRDEIVLATKVGMPRGAAPPGTWHRRDHIVASCDESLRRLRTDRVDLYQLHRPSLVVPQDETLAAFDELVRAGKVRHLGCSTHPAWMVMEALCIAARDDRPAYATEQPPYNLLDRRVENELLPLCRAHGLGVLPWSPLGAGILAGRYDDVDEIPDGARAARRPQLRERLTPAALDVARGLRALAAERGLTSAQLALLWAKDQPDVTAPIVGPRTRSQLQDALGVLERSLDDEARAACDELVPAGSAVADFHNTSGWMRERIT
ncbi:MAG TPA: aldo/keto reductase [Acidimicrobiia bacterium]|nr:aldo/keto reductase [Acidimicrobiia bacterium]HEV3451126.1 aldo/keto reductase [Acidimicrobiia bacterium]